MKTGRTLVYVAAAVLLLLSAGCGAFTSGAVFTGEVDLDKNDAVTTVQKWFMSLEFIRSANEKGEMVPNKDNGRDFWLYLEVVDPRFLLDQADQFVGEEQLQVVRGEWSKPEWEVEFKDVEIQLVGDEEENRDRGTATVEIVKGTIRYIGDFFGTTELKQDSYGDKKGEIYLRWIPPDPEGDLLVMIAEQVDDVPQDYRERYRALAESGRWVITGGLDLSEEDTFGETPSD